MSDRTYKIRKFQNGSNKEGVPFLNYSLTIPGRIAEKLPQDIQFSCLLTQEGILFRPSLGPTEEEEVPDWVLEMIEAEEEESEE